jgi:hypothetical protein
MHVIKYTYDFKIIIRKKLKKYHKKNWSWWIGSKNVALQRAAKDDSLTTVGH